MSTAERSLTGGLVLGAVFYGIHVCIFSTTIYHMHISGPVKKTSKWVHAFTWIMFVLGTVNLVCATSLVQRMWTYGTDYEGGAYQWLWDNFDDPINFLANACVSPLFLLHDIVLLYRLSAIYCLTRHRHLLLALFFTAILGASVVSALRFLRLIQPEGAHEAVVKLAYAVPHCGLTTATNAAMTLAIVGRMVYLRQRVINVLGEEHARLYTSVAAMFVESGAIYSILLLVCVVPASHTEGKGLPSVVFLALAQASGYSTGLIAMRFALGRAWSQATVQPNNTVGFANLPPTHFTLPFEADRPNL